MATRSLTEVFILMRNNAMQNRHLFSDHHEDDKQALVSRDTDLEAGMHYSKSSKLPPEWVDSLEEIQYDLSRIHDKMKDLATLHDRHLNRPTLDDSVAEEHAIDIQTQQITQMFHKCQRGVQHINARSRLGTEKEQKLAKNIAGSLAREVQDASIAFRKSQSSYLRKLQSREERSKQFFDVDLNDGYVPDELDEIYERGFTASQMQATEDNTRHMLEREKEVQDIVRSIQDLNEIFKDLASMVVDQGTVLDNIDYNIEQTSQRVDEGLKQLKKAAKYQKKNRKMMIILILFAIIILLIIILIASKS